MDLCQKKKDFETTIAAIATPPGAGGIAVIRLSGKEAIEIASKIFSGPVKDYKSHTVHFGIVKDKQGVKIDDALLVVMEGPKSYTGEDVIEIQCHGGTIASTRILETMIQVGATLASPGEFTYRAFVNGKLDLAQAEAVQKLIGAKSDKAFDIASKQLEGALSRKINEINKDLLFLAALFEAWVDFPEEGLEFTTLEEAKNKLKAAYHKIEKLLATYHEGEKLHHGISLCIVGAPNVGKSSLLNALLEKERAIVTPIAGTTRDLIECDFTLNGLLFRLIDTAGIRECEDIVEKEGINRSKTALQNSDLVLLVLDAEKGIKKEEKQFLDLIPQEKTIAIWNKIDKATPKISLPFPHVIALSAQQKIGIDELKKKIDEVVKIKDFSKEEVILTSLRHEEALINAKKAVLKTLQGLEKNAFQELLAYEIRFALRELGKILGNDVSEDILSTIFSNFCIGK